MTRLIFLAFAIFLPVGVAHASE
jgi:tripartite-type tricarboxylate transporter receptor subunit TctC